ncbi:MAG: tyrosine--tRNA ligase [Patescibacteria group bacterium UBA2163]
MFGARKVITDEKKIDELLSRSVTELIPGEDSFKELLMSGKRLRIKLGIDPTSPHIHLGRAVTLLKLRDFQELGHEVVLIVGDFTAVIGDTSDKSAERPMLDRETILKNKKTYFEQAGKVLNLNLVERKSNAEWLSKLTYQEIGEHADQFSVSDFIARDNIKRRLDEGKRVSLREVMYPLMQGYDSVAVNADVELGGTDQRFNLLAGRTLQSRYGQEPQHILTTELILGTDGRKMSSSWGNTINLTDVADDMYGKIMSIPDTLIESYFVHCTRVPLSRVSELIGGHPRDAKKELAYEVVRMYHSQRAADEAKEYFEKTFAQKEVPQDVPECVVGHDTAIADALSECGVVASKSEFRRLLEGGGVKVADGGQKLTKEDIDSVADGTVLRLGKRVFVKIVRK